MDKQVKQEITRLLREQDAIDRAKKHQCLIVGSSSQFIELVRTVAMSEYSELPPAWAISLYLSRN